MSVEIAQRWQADAHDENPTLPDDQQGAASAIEFLTKFHPARPWALTAIQPDRRAIETRTFMPDEADAARAWIVKHDGARNLYFHVNEVTGRVSKKADKAGMRAAHYLHVDIDPRAGENLAAEQQRIRALVENWRGDLPPPHVVVWSGGGAQCYWRLQEPVPINGDVTAAEGFERYSKAIELALGGDNCHNVDRVMRLPGTLNIPDEKKRKKGRVACRAYVMTASEGAIPLGAIQPVAPSANGTSTAGQPTTDLSVLEKWQVPESVMRVVKDGALPQEECTEKQATFSRSEWVFYTVCELVRHGVPDEVVVSLITDARWAISAHVHAQRGDPDKYALRQVARARAAVDAQPPLLFSGTPLRSAREFTRRRRPTLMHVNDDWLVYDGAAYVELENSTIRSELYAFLDGAQTRNKDDRVVPFSPNTTKVSNVGDALQGAAHRERDKTVAPCWLDFAGPPPSEIIACRNGLLHITSGELLPGTAQFFTRNALTFAYASDTSAPRRWLSFLQSLWPDDAASIAALQEIIGYALVPDTSQQKIFMLVGPPRSGKGTVARVLTELVGAHNVCAPTLSSLSGQFGLEPLVGKQLAIVSDMRLGRHTDHAAVTENLLRISGEDMVTANRKYKLAWHGKLSVRFLVMTNEMPTFADSSGALANRFVPLVMRQSFLGRENPALLGELLPELPGILQWAIEGWRRLRARGHFELPASARDAVQSLADLASPELAFLRDECEVNPAATQPKAEVFSAWRAWCERNGQAFPNTLEVFSSRLQAASEGRVTTTKIRAPGRRVPAFKGLRLAPAQPSDDGGQIPF